jgi:hypothetical protein
MPGVNLLKCVMRFEWRPVRANEERYSSKVPQSWHTWVGDRYHVLRCRRKPRPPPTLQQVLEALQCGLITHDQARELLSHVDRAP